MDLKVTDLLKKDFSSNYISFFGGNDFVGSNVLDFLIFI